MFVDEATISIKAGKGGDGIAKFFPGYKTGPSGGDGGVGASVFIKGSRNVGDLHKYVTQTKFIAPNGDDGENFKMEGKNGEDLILLVPVGTLVIDTETESKIEINDTETQYMLARGGKGGRGNAHYATATRYSPQHFQTGREGQKKSLRLILRLIADFGLIGLPNAGKSSLLNELTAAKVKTANYPFTTLEPNLGVFAERVIADIPGLIEGAAQGKGLGIKFLKHVEKVPILLHCIAADSPDIHQDYETIMDEMKKYNEELIQKPQAILLTKTDLVTETEIKEKMKVLKKLQKKVLPVSIYNPEQFTQLQKYLRSMV